VLQGKWARTGMIATRGFRDVIELARQRRPHYFNIDIPKPAPPTPRDCRVEVTERIAHDGAVVTPLVEEEIHDAVGKLRSAGVDAIAVCFVHSYANPEHERAVAGWLRELLPDVPVSLEVR